MKPSQWAAGIVLALIGYAVCDALGVWQGFGVGIGYTLGFALMGAYDN
jgi:hypothetical protein